MCKYFFDVKYFLLCFLFIIGKRPRGTSAGRAKAYYRKFKSYGYSGFNKSYKDIAQFMGQLMVFAKDDGERRREAERQNRMNADEQSRNQNDEFFTEDDEDEL